MSNPTRNIDLTGSHLPERLVALREERHLTKADLAEMANLSARTIHDLENGRRDRIQEKTLMLLAKALEVSAEELLDRPARIKSESVAEAPTSGSKTLNVPSKGPRRLSLRTGLIILTVLLGILAVAWMNMWSFACDNAQWVLDRNSLQVRDTIFGTEIWHLSNENQISFCQVSPWRSDRLLVGLGSETPSGGRLLNLNRANGDTIWSVGPDIPAIVRAFGQEDVLATNFQCSKVLQIELDGDPSTELAVIFTHGRLYPLALCAVDDDGRRLSQYANKGHLGDFLITDLDEDGREELIAAGTNNAKAYQGYRV